jgi:hypothetical protein
MYKIENVSMSLLLGLILYVMLEIILHYLSMNKTTKVKRTLPYYAAISIGYFIKDYYKGNSKNVVRGIFIETCNFWNLIVSFVLLIISLVVAFAKPDYLIYLVGFNFWRFYSRNSEIILAFGFDVLNKKPTKTGDYFDKFNRLKLAVVSYFEIYLYSASFYVSLPISNCESISLGLKSMLMSFAIGSLTNVAYAQDILSKHDCCFDFSSDWLQLLPFFQVIATLSLIVLSLTIYISREPSKFKNKKHPWSLL